jgi:hypothetical protein
MPWAVHRAVWVKTGLTVPCLHTQIENTQKTRVSLEMILQYMAKAVSARPGECNTHLTARIHKVPVCRERSDLPEVNFRFLLYIKWTGRKPKKPIRKKAHKKGASRHNGNFKWPRVVGWFEYLKGDK